MQDIDALETKVVNCPNCGFYTFYWDTFNDSGAIGFCTTCGKRYKVKVKEELVEQKGASNDPPVTK